MYTSDTFNLTTSAGFNNAEKEKERLYNIYDNVSAVYNWNYTTVYFECWND